MFHRGSTKISLRVHQVSILFHFLWPLNSDCLCFQPRSSSDSQPPEASVQTGELVIAEADIQLSPLGSTDQEVPFTEVHAQLAPAEQEEKEEKEEQEVKEVEKEEEEEKGGEEMSGVEVDLSVVSERVYQEYALSSTLPQEEKEEERGAGEEKEEGS